MGDAFEDEAAALRTRSSSFEASAAQILARDMGDLQRYNNRNGSIHRSSNISENPAKSPAQSLECGERGSTGSLQNLTEKLEFLRKQKEETDKQAEEDEVEAKTNHGELAKERERLRQAFKEKEDLSAELKRQGIHLDKINRSAQSRKATKIKQLYQKRAERQRLNDDTTRLENEILDMKHDIDEMNVELAYANEAKDDDLTGIKKDIAEDLCVNGSLEEEIRIKAAEIKALEERKEQISAEDVEEQESSRFKKDKDEAWEAHSQALQGQIGSMWQTLQQARLEVQQSEDALHWWIDKRARNPDQFAPIPALDLPAYVRRNRSRKSQHVNTRHGPIPSPNYQMMSTAPSAIAAPPPYPLASPLLNVRKGMTIPSESDQIEPSQSEAEALTGGAMMSPAANQLLPSNLLGDEEFANPDTSDAVSRETLETSSHNPFIKHTLSNSDTSFPTPHTPLSTGSRAGSVFSSPHDSMQNLQGFPSSQEAYSDNDLHSINSTSAPLHGSLAADPNPLATSRLANLFSSPFSRQRGKRSTQDAPMLGTLKQGQSQSFPRHFEQEAVDSAANRRRRGSHGTWVNPMTALLARNSSDAPENGIITARTFSGRNSRLNMFKPKLDALDPSVFAEKKTSRPSSTYSYDQTYGKASSESQRLWWPVSETIPSRTSPLGATWAPSNGPWSHMPSRRASIQHGSSTNLSIGSTPLEPDEMPTSLLRQRSEQAPIGTRPKSSQRPTTPRLNPAAPSFKTLFRGKLERSTGKVSEKHKDKDNESSEQEESEIANEASPPRPRLSRDAQSITTATSTADSHDSFERSTSGTPSDTIASGQKESLMQKITRKSSSSKFNVPWSKDRGIFSKKAGEPSTPGEIDEDLSSDGQISKNIESTASTPQQEKNGRANISWPNIRRKSKKGTDTSDGGDGGDNDG